MASSQKRKREANGEMAQSTPKYTRVVPPGFEDRIGIFDNSKSSLRTDVKQSKPSKPGKSTAKPPPTNGPAKGSPAGKASKSSRVTKHAPASANKKEESQNTVVLPEEENATAVISGSKEDNTEAKVKSNKEGSQTEAELTTARRRKSANEVMVVIDSSKQNGKIDVDLDGGKIGSQRQKRKAKKEKEVTTGQIPHGTTDSATDEKPAKTDSKNTTATHADRNETRSPRQKRHSKTGKEVAGILKQSDMVEVDLDKQAPETDTQDTTILQHDGKETKAWRQKRSQEEGCKTVGTLIRGEAADTGIDEEAPQTDTKENTTPQTDGKPSRARRRKLRREAVMKAAGTLVQGDKTNFNSGDEASRANRTETKTPNRKQSREAKREAPGILAGGDKIDIESSKEGPETDVGETKAGGNETRGQRRKRKREEEKESGDTLDRGDAKRPKSKHGTPPKPTTAGKTESQPADESQPPKQDARSAKGGKRAEVGSRDASVGAKDMRMATPLKQNGDVGELQASNNEEKSLVKSSSHSSASKVSKSVEHWQTSEPIGGHLVNADTVFSVDEEYLILALPSALQIYSASTSLLVRSLSLESSRSRKAGVTSYVLSPTCPNQVYICTTRGRLEIWDWMLGTKLQRWEFESEMHSLAVIPSESAEKKSDIIYVVEKKRGKWRIKLFELTKAADATNTDSKTKRLFESDQPISSLRVLHGGQTIFATSANKLIVGTTKENVSTASYVWIELTSLNWLTCLDVRDSSKRPPPPKGKNEKAKGVQALSSNLTVDVVVGDLKGVIFVHTDLLNKLDIMRPASKPAGWEYELKSATKKMHWHREAVHSVKWSLDGNYIISGGSETVLVLWQMATNKSQHLPHLSATVENIVVSPKGSSYAVRLADNSVMILSTSELKPKANIAGIQAISWKPVRIPEEVQVKTVDSEELKEQGTPEITRVPSLINPANPSQLLLAVPSFQANSFGPALHLGSPFLQTYDFVAAQHVSRQVLARAYVTWKNVSSEQAKVGEPTIVLMKISSNGKWLATVDEWVPPARDLKFLGLDADDLAKEQSRRREVFLKFWNWNKEHTQWELVARVDHSHSQHGRPSSGTGQITDMVAHPKALEFATIGTDGSVRIWALRKKTRDGIVVKNVENSKPQLYWSCRQTTQLDRRDGTVLLVKSRKGYTRIEICVRSSLAYSEDGSVLAASSPGVFAQDPSVVRLIDAASGEIKHIREGLITSPIITIGMIGPYLILVGDSLVIWDIVRDTFQYGYKLRNSAFSLHQRAERFGMVHLAVNQTNGTFAVAHPASGSHEDRRKRSEVLVFDPTDPTPIHVDTLPNVVTSLLPAVGSNGYIIIDVAAELRIVGLKGSKGVLQTITRRTLIDKNLPQQEKEGVDPQDAETTDAQDRGLGDKMVIDSYLPRPDAPNHGEDDDSPVVRREKLAEIFDVGPSYALPPVSQLFDQVASLFLKKPLPREEMV